MAKFAVRISLTKTGAGNKGAIHKRQVELTASLNALPSEIEEVSRLLYDVERAINDAYGLRAHIFFEREEE